MRIMSGSGQQVALAGIDAILRESVELMVLRVMAVFLMEEAAPPGRVRMLFSLGRGARRPIVPPVRPRPSLQQRPVCNSQYCTVTHVLPII
jgi:hypothetical protein